MLRRAYSSGMSAMTMNPGANRTAAPVLKRAGAAVGLLAAVCLGLAGCRVHVDKDANGQDKNVQVDTPFGGVHVNTGQISAADLGLPVYPGAQIVPDKDNDKSADVHMGFGHWELRVKTVNYSTPDSQDKVEAFYRKALGRYGDVITCQNNAAVGKPAVTAEGLSCQDNGRNQPNVHVNMGDRNYGGSSNKNDLELKAGSPHRQHIVGFEAPVNGQTRFSLVYLELPDDAGGNSGASD
ncbi:MAG TPA: hypothetical protein VKU93_05700 [Terracidiphilus sp.]|nr:hypothetical protein [Terracidiphilus sp.]